MTTSSPIARSRSIAARDVGRIGSATAMTPASAPSTATYIGVLPSPASRATSSAIDATSTAHACISAALPTASPCPPTAPVAPRPVSDANCSGTVSDSPRSRAARTMASASGCSLIVSSDATSATSSASVCTAPGARTTSVTVGLPSVTVPVLSSTIVVTSPARCSASPPLISTPSSAPRPVATITAVGTASPIAHGQAMMSTATAAANARTSDAPAGVPVACASTNHAVERDDREAQHDGHEDAADAIGQSPGWARASPARRA